MSVRRLGINTDLHHHLRQRHFVNIRRLLHSNEQVRTLHPRGNCSGPQDEACEGDEVKQPRHVWPMHGAWEIEGIGDWFRVSGTIYRGEPRVRKGKIIELGHSGILQFYEMARDEPGHLSGTRGEHLGYVLWSVGYDGLRALEARPGHVLVQIR